VWVPCVDRGGADCPDFADCTLSAPDLVNRESWGEMSAQTVLSAGRRIVLACLLVLPLAAVSECGGVEDADEDGFSPSDEDLEEVDCNDNDPTVNPGARDVCDGIDCDDGVEAIHPGADEICNGLDDDWGGVLSPDEVDADLDGCPDCDTCTDNAHPAPTGLEDGMNENFDGDVPALEADGTA
jgi:hypothetical protein